LIQLNRKVKNGDRIRIKGADKREEEQGGIKVGFLEDAKLKEDEQHFKIMIK
jgi:hypothetical protein